MAIDEPYLDTPDAIVLGFNDHTTSFSLDLIPMFAIGTATSHAVADEGWGPRPVLEVADGPSPTVEHRSSRVPARNTALGHPVLNESNLDLPTMEPA